MRLLYLLSTTIHLLAMAVWVGSMLSFVLVLIPVLRVPELVAVRPVFLQKGALRVRWIGWICLALLGLTGAFQVFIRFGFDAVLSGSGAIVEIVRWKIALFALLVVLQALHDFWVGPRAAQLAVSAPEAAESRSFVRHARRLGRSTLLVTLAMVLLGVSLVRGLP